jgi:hypothetical protein
MFQCEGFRFQCKDGCICFAALLHYEFTMNESHLVHVRGRGEGEKHVQARQLPPLCRYKERCCPIDGYLLKRVKKRVYVHIMFSERGLNNEVLV